MNSTFGSKFNLGSRIGNGSFGEIYLAKNKNTSEEVAAKVEILSDKITKSQLRREAKIYKELQAVGGVPKIRWFGASDDTNILVMDLLGKSLEDLFNYCGRRFTLKTVLLLAYELINRIESIHSKGFLHRDIKPENFLMGRGRDRHTVFVIDFGLAKYYKNPRTDNHIPDKSGYSLTGTARYASLNAHDGLEQSRRDDLFSIGYVLLYFLRGSLPWQGLQAEGAKEDKYQLILDKKRATSKEELCRNEEGTFPDEFRAYFSHLEDLGFYDKPDYLYLKNLFKDLFTKRKYTHDSVLFDWEVLAYKKQKQAQQQQQQQQQTTATR